MTTAITTNIAYPTALTKLKSKLLLYPGPAFEVAGLTSIHPSTLSMYARGTKPIRPDHLQRLCEFFDCNSEDLIGVLMSDDPFWEAM